MLIIASCAIQNTAYQGLCGWIPASFVAWTNVGPSESWSAGSVTFCDNGVEAVVVGPHFGIGCGKADTVPV